MINLVHRRLRRALGPIALSTCLMLLVLLGYGGEALAAQRGTEESLVRDLALSVNAFWEREFASRGYPYSPVSLGFVYDEPVISGCGLVYPNEGPLYCLLDQTLYYPVDWRYEGRDLASYGEPVLGWAIAHEVGHHAQQQMDEFGIQGWFSITLEQAEIQADCFAGAWASQADRELGTGDTESVLAALQNAGGPGHGTSSERIAAFESGYSSGDVAQCLAPDETGSA